MGHRKHSCLPRVEQLEDRSLMSANVVLDWNQVVLDAIKATGTNPLLGSRALAITQAAVYDAVNAIDGTHASYAFNGQASPGASPEAAVASAAYHTLIELFPTRQATFKAALQSSLAAVPDGAAENSGIAVGRAAARSILALRRHDGAGEVVTYTPGTDPGDWQPTPPPNLPALGPQWPDVTPFTMSSGAQFRPAAPPDLDSAEYATAFNEVKVAGAADAETVDRNIDDELDRTPDETQIARFWADGAGTSFAFGHWNIIAQGVATEQDLDIAEQARMFALLNLATADAIIVSWDAKYEYNFWRPITAIRFAGAGDLNPDTTSESTWTPLLGTPNFPAYTSGHSTVSSAAATVLTELFGGSYQFTVGSEGLAGVTRTFESFQLAAEEAGQSRIFGGIHFQFDNQAGLASGLALGQFIIGNFLLPVEEGDSQERSAGSKVLRSESVGVLFMGMSNGSTSSDGGLISRQASTPAGGQRLEQMARSRDVSPSLGLTRRALDQALADLEDGMFADPLQGEEIFA